MSHRTHRHDARAPIGAVLLKLGLHLAGALIKKKMGERMAAKRPAYGNPPRRA